ncbi:MAG: polysaccharide biosynthesis protein [Candidatus Nitricoxidivorans perseverans]|uniref:Polysaccharide biosynthesis protein n=1 Tax=Candidatus Nitricoxidivorans perseverans TaxID=2975601 RepID=A0AA49FJX6_9PROT|nr:MAG: polysaccharide biosynthesis protein [Candidatus Nitricoxidivorans perseverans]
MGLSSYYSDKRILVTGGCGTVGKELVRQLASQSPLELRVLDNSEDGVFALNQEFGHLPCVNAVIGDIRDEHRIHDASEGVDILFHVAALKHVQICERAPGDAVMTNIVGTQNVIRAALNNKVKTCLLTSTDKAVNPTNVMGTSKLMAERLMTAANNYSGKESVRFASTRFGNVLASRGSVVRIFYEQIRQGGPITITDATMTRFIMTIQESARLILAGARLAKGGEVFVPKMPIIRIVDLAAAMISLFAPKLGCDPASIQIAYVGRRPGEKTYEELMTGEESARATELDDLFAILPSRGSLRWEIDYSYPGGVRPADNCSYDTDKGPFLSQQEICGFLEAAAIDLLLENNQ